MLGVFPNSAPDSVNKDLGLTHALAKEGLEFLLVYSLVYRDLSLILHLPLVLLPAKQGGILEEVAANGTRF